MVNSLNDLANRISDLESKSALMTNYLSSTTNQLISLQFEVGTLVQGSATGELAASNVARSLAHLSNAQAKIDNLKSKSSEYLANIRN